MQNNGVDNFLIALLGTDFILFCDTMIALFSLYHCYEGALLLLTKTLPAGAGPYIYVYLAAEMHVNMAP